eukprot:s3587_g6.t6
MTCAGKETCVLRLGFFGDKALTRPWEILGVQWRRQHLPRQPGDSLALTSAFVYGACTVMLKPRSELGSPADLTGYDLQRPQADLRPALRGEGGSAPSRQLVLVQIATSREGSTMASVITCPKDRLRLTCRAKFEHQSLIATAFANVQTISKETGHQGPEASPSRGLRVGFPLSGVHHGMPYGCQEAKVQLKKAGLWTDLKVQYPWCSMLTYMLLSLFRSAGGFCRRGEPNPKVGGGGGPVRGVHHVPKALSYLDDHNILNFVEPVLQTSVQAAAGGGATPDSINPEGPLDKLEEEEVKEPGWNMMPSVCTWYMIPMPVIKPPAAEPGPAETVLTVRSDDQPPTVETMWLGGGLVQAQTLAAYGPVIVEVPATPARPMVAGLGLLALGQSVLVFHGTRRPRSFGPAAEPAAVASVVGRVGRAVDKVWVRFRAVEQLARDAFLGTSTACYTSLGSIFKAFGSVRFTVPRGRQICGLHFEGSTMASVITCPKDPLLGFGRALMTETCEPARRAACFPESEGPINLGTAAL